MELFNEVKNKYFRILIKVLSHAKFGMTRDDIIKIIDEEEYSQKLIDKNSRTFTGMILNDYSEKYNFGLLKKEDQKYYPKINKSNNVIPTRLTMVEKMWLKSILNTEFIKLFLDDELIKCLKMELKSVNSCIKDEYIEFTNKIKSDYKYDEIYKNNFRKILDSILNEKVISYYEFDSNNKKYLKKIAFPVTIEYSIRDSDFRVSMYLIDDKIVQKLIQILDLSKREIDDFPDTYPKSKLNASLKEFKINLENDYKAELIRAALGGIKSLIDVH
jgi:hypothetical protein